MSYEKLRAARALVRDALYMMSVADRLRLVRAVSEARQTNLNILDEIESFNERLKLGDHRRVRNFDGKA